MTINWDEVQKTLTPLKDYEDLCQRFKKSFAYSFVRDGFNFTMPELVTYTHKLLGGDSRNRYIEYESMLIRILKQLDEAGVQTLLDLVLRTENREKMELFSEQSKVSAADTVSVLKYLVYWFIPGEKYLSGLVRDNPSISEAIKTLNELGLRTNLEILQEGRTPSARKELAARSRLSLPVISEVVNRADFSRMPWASKATISNIIGAGYGSLVQLANANPEQLYTDFFRYGNSIKKNLKLGNEIENSYRIAKIVPVLVQDS